jgi:hypothetical protein
LWCVDPLLRVWKIKKTTGISILRKIIWRNTTNTTYSCYWHFLYVVRNLVIQKLTEYFWKKCGSRLLPLKLKPI